MFKLVISICILLTLFCNQMLAATSNHNRSISPSSRDVHKFKDKVSEPYEFKDEKLVKKLRVIILLKLYGIYYRAVSNLISKSINDFETAAVVQEEFSVICEDFLQQSPDSNAQNFFRLSYEYESGIGEIYKKIQEESKIKRYSPNLMKLLQAGFLYKQNVALVLEPPEILIQRKWLKERRALHDSVFSGSAASLTRFTEDYGIDAGQLLEKTGDANLSFQLPITEFKTTANYLQQNYLEEAEMPLLMQTAYRKDFLGQVIKSAVDLSYFTMDALRLKDIIDMSDIKYAKSVKFLKIVNGLLFEYLGHKTDNLKLKMLNEMVKLHTQLFDKMEVGNQYTKNLYEFSKKIDAKVSLMYPSPEDKTSLRAISAFMHEYNNQRQQITDLASINRTYAQLALKSFEIKSEQYEKENDLINTIKKRLSSIVRLN